MRNVIASVLQLVGGVGVVAAAWLISPAAGLLAGSAAVLVVGVLVDPTR